MKTYTNLKGYLKVKLYNSPCTNLIIYQLSVSNNYYSINIDYRMFTDNETSGQ